MPEYESDDALHLCIRGHPDGAGGGRSRSKYPPAEPGALGLEPLKAACPCCPARLSSPTLRNASPLCAEATRVGPIAAALYNAPHLRVCIATWSALSFHSDPSTGFPFACLAALGSESRRWTEGVDPRICQTFAASPAEPGELPYVFREEGPLAARAYILAC